MVLTIWILSVLLFLVIVVVILTVCDTKKIIKQKGRYEAEMMKMGEELSNYKKAFGRDLRKCNDCGQHLVEVMFYGSYFPVKFCPKCTAANNARMESEIISARDERQDDYWYNEYTRAEVENDLMALKIKRIEKENVDLSRTINNQDKDIKSRAKLCKKSEDKIKELQNVVDVLRGIK